MYVPQPMYIPVSMPHMPQMPQMTMAMPGVPQYAYTQYHTVVEVEYIFC